MIFTIPLRNDGDEGMAIGGIPLRLGYILTSSCPKSWYLIPEWSSILKQKTECTWCLQTRPRSIYTSV
jgi:hypothetical protein